MPAKPPKRPATQRRLMTGTLIDNDPKAVSRLLSDLADRVGELDDQSTSSVHTSAPATGSGTSTDPVTVSTFSSSARGVVPASGGGSTNFLRADGTWAPAGAGAGVSSVTAGSSAVSASPTTGAVIVDVVEANFAGIPESAVTNLTTDLAAKAPTARLINTTAPLFGGGDLTADRTLTVGSFDSIRSGVVPASGGGTANFLRADQTWAVPPGTGVPTSRLINTTSPLQGGGDLSADRTLSIATNGIDNTLIRQGGATSVIGRSASSTGNVADIAASADHQILARSSGALLFSDVGNIMLFLGLFGDGSDGALNFDGTSTVTLADGTTIVPVANVYTLNHEICATDITVGASATIQQGAATAFRIMWTGTLTVTGKISADGTSSPNQSGASGTSGWVTVGSGGGGSGGSSGGGASASTAITGINPGFFAAASHAGAAINTAGTNGVTGGGQGGTGGGGSTSGSGNVAANARPVATLGSIRTFHSLSEGRTTGSSSATASNGVPFGLGGTAGSGGGGNASGAGGGGGGGAGCLILIGRTITGAGSLTAKGGNGGPGAAGGAGTGGGGGGGGGAIVIIYANGTVPTTNVSGGTGGTATGTGGVGGNGGSGAVVTVNL